MKKNGQLKRRDKEKEGSKYSDPLGTLGASGSVLRYMIGVISRGPHARDQIHTVVKVPWLNEAFHTIPRINCTEVCVKKVLEAKDFLR